MNPEIKIERLYNSVMDLINTSSSFLQEQTFAEEENLRKVLRKIIIAKTLYEKNIIAISGLQGVGKSTIIKNFYELDEESLPIVAGRGERIPILVTEYPIEKPEAYAIINHKNEQGLWVNKEIPVSFVEFKKYARGEDMSAMLLGLRVPYKHFQNNITSFLILPGFEGTGEDYWETLIDFSLTCASTVIFAVNEAKMADQQNKDKVMQILHEYQGIKPIFAMTFADQSKDQNAQLRDTIKETFQIEEDTRIVSVGAYTKEENRKWAGNLLKAIESYSAMTADYRNKQLKQLRNLLKRDLLRSVRSIRDELSYVELDRSMDRVNEGLKVFDEEKELIQRSYTKKLKKAYDSCESEAGRKAKAIVGGKSSLEKLKETILKKSLKDLIKMEESIISMTFDDQFNSHRETVFQSKNREACINTISDKLGIVFEQENGEVKVIQGSEGKFDIVEVADPESVKKNKYFMKPEISRDLTTIMMKDVEVTQFKSLDLAEVIRFIPAIATVNYGAFFDERYLDTRNLIVKDESQQSNNWSFLKQTPENITNGFKAVAGISLLDSIDGSPDIILSAAKNLGIKMTQNVAFAITGGIAAGALAVGILREMNQNDFADLNLYTAGFRTIRFSCETNYIERYEDYMDNVRENLKLRLMEGYGVKRLDIRIDNLMIAINRLENNVIEMEGMISDIYS